MSTPTTDPGTTTTPWGDTVLVDFDDGIAWVTLNRPEKRNAMNPAMNDEMVRTLDALEADPRCRVMVLTGAGESFSAGMDLKEYFREVDQTADPSVQIRVRRASAEWQWKRLAHWSKPTIAMVNGWCFGGAFTPLVACDLAISDEEARYGLSEINWGIPPGGVVSRALAAAVSQRDALYFIMTGETFDGRRAEGMRLVNEAVPAERLRERTRELALKLASTNPVVLRAAKVGYKIAREMPWEQAEDYLYAKLEQSQFLDAERGREKGMAQFLDDKSYRPGLSAYSTD
ncbi:vanillin synthase /trans-feruloyl-CoA hydratase [Saccharopolyspora erythraea NRRL 2338]|uniref:Enoyl-CoA hydratase/isomerase n=2 Tax=Saccharopolyspora erythraea TaxID=1836 RepID=A4FDF0_SACEN|nr:p-hydroxycinnamoyl CoA hydratase/lyase [Saccharopolyspora erythraea]EQD84843.1 crotonase [Saccharopolyspora erythraea D]PFG95815.1 vanillin synthase /trans-feruloyl-CoA hydratase [Saccharopolyspora erythraea NRRL 2338]QRK92398.1 p-hydroxycinnamoyl CoA hydratase/lyase [Saccharopolyspora erythraea]CAM02075.1 enoyl-CoA hydratase/isomerase [Saccharopolyspora erythraea NRRL 2338]